MSDKFQQGDRVKIIGGELRRRVGKLATVIGPRVMCESTLSGKVTLMYPVNVDGEGIIGRHGAPIHYPEHWLAPFQERKGFTGSTWKATEAA